MRLKKYWYAFVVSNAAKLSLRAGKPEVGVVFVPVQIGTRLSLAELDLFLGAKKGIVSHVG